MDKSHRFPGTCRFMFFVVMATSTANAQNAVLTGVNSLMVRVSWENASETETSTLRNDVELRIRKTGLMILPWDESLARYATRLTVIVGRLNPASIVVQTLEPVYVSREVMSAWDNTESNKYFAWVMEAIHDEKKSTDAEMAEHYKPVERETKRNRALALPAPRDAVTWALTGSVGVSPSETVNQVIQRYSQSSLWETPAGRPIIQHRMDLEVQAAMETEKASPRLSNIQLVVDSFVDSFVSDWMKANQK